MNMVKLWDNKIVNLRNELNIQSIYRKLDTFSKKEEVAEQIKGLAKEDQATNASILDLKVMIGKLGQMNEAVEQKIEDLYSL